MLLRIRFSNSHFNGIPPSCCGSISALERMGLSPTKKRRIAGEAASAEPFEHYKFDGEESSMHLEWRARQGKGHQRMIRTVQECLVWLLGVGLGLLVGSMTIASRASDPPPPPYRTLRPGPARNPRSAPTTLTCPQPSPALRRCITWSCMRRIWHCTRAAPRGWPTWVPPSPPTRGSTC